MSLPLWPEERSGETGGHRSAPAPPRRVSLVRLTGEIARNLATIGRVAVEGEVHRPAQSRGGWVFFVLRDRAAEIRVAVPRRSLPHCRVVAGERALVTGAIEWLSDRGALQLRASEITPVGEGAVAAMVAETRRRLAGDGLLERPRRMVPILPRAIGVVCGADAAVRGDIESVVAVRFPGYPLVVHETTVSGPGAATAIAEGLRLVVRQSGVDAVILARGGGDATQLLPWSDEAVCRAVAACPVPVVSAIGHDSDRPLCDEVADLRCGTPSLAAAATVPDRAALEAHLGRLADQRHREVNHCSEMAVRRLDAVDTAGALRRGVGAASERLIRGRQRLDGLHPGRELIGARRRLAAIDWRRPAGERLGRAAGRWEAEGRHLRALRPEAVLARGYAVVRRADGTVVRSAAQVATGERVDVRVARGELRALVEEAFGD